MKCTSLIALLFFSFLPDGFCQSAELFGTAEQFANESLLVKKKSNPITGDSETIDTIFFNDKGNFNSSVEITDPGWIFINTGIFRLVMYLVPGYTYEITLPPKTKKTEADIRNPFFKPIVAHIQIEKEYRLNKTEPTISFNDINSRIFRFDTLLSSKNKEMLEAIRNQDKYNSDSLIFTLEAGYKDDSSEYFRNYRRFRYGIIKINSRDVGLQKIYENFLKTETPKTENPAYMELFNEMYNEFLFFYSRTDEGKNIRYVVNQLHDKYALIDTLMKHPAVPARKLSELIILKEIYDIYTKDYFNKESLLSILDSIILKPESSENSKYASGIKTYLTRLDTGKKAPDFRLIDVHNSYKSLNDFRKKYVYLNFCTPDNYSCLKEFPFLEAMNKVHQDHLYIVTIMVTKSIDEMKDFMIKNHYDWIALFYGNDESLLKNYNVKAYPTCYLLDPEGKIIRSPANLATEGFEQQLFNIMRARGDL